MKKEQHRKQRLHELLNHKSKEAVVHQADVAGNFGTTSCRGPAAEIVKNTTTSTGFRSFVRSLFFWLRAYGILIRHVVVACRRRRTKKKGLEHTPAQREKVRKG